MQNEPVSLGKKANNGLMVSPKEALQDALDAIGADDGGAFEKTKKVLILAIDDTDGDYDVGFIQAGMKMSECVALCEISKGIFKREMNY